jgi:hypothetical protein
VKIVIERNHVAGQWAAKLGDNPEPVIAIGADAREAVIAIQRLYPDALVGVASKVFGPATIAAYGPVVWMQPNLN